MTAETTRARAAADLAAGRLPTALQRLRGLVGSCPADLAARQQLAEVYRRYGEPAQAGRWSYLCEGRDPAETTTFEERHPHPFDRMRAVGWRGPESDAPTEFARQRLADLREAATVVHGSPVHWWNIPEVEKPARTASPGGSGTRERWQAAGCGALAIAVVALIVFLLVVGVRTVLGWWS